MERGIALAGRIGGRYGPYRLQTLAIWFFVASLQGVLFAVLRWLLSSCRVGFGCAAGRLEMIGALVAGELGS